MLHEHMARVGQNRSRSLKWAEKQENFQPKEMCFFLTSTFIERIRTAGRPGRAAPRSCRGRLHWLIPRGLSTQRSHNRGDLQGVARSFE